LCLAGDAILSHLIVDGATLCAESGHVVENSGEIYHWADRDSARQKT